MRLVKVTCTVMVRCATPIHTQGLHVTRLPPSADRHPHDGHREHAHDHSHGLVDESIKRSREGVKAVSIALGILAGTAAIQALVFALTGSLALLADLIHNGGDALTAIPLGIAFALRSPRAERLAGLAVVAAIFISSCVAAYESILRLVHHPRPDTCSSSHSPARSDSPATGSPPRYVPAPGTDWPVPH